MSKQSRLSLLLLLVALTCGGCAKWKRPEFSLNSLRDPRAVDIDDRLSAPPLDTRDRKGE